MARPQDAPPVFTAAYSPIAEHYAAGDPLSRSNSTNCFGRFCCWWDNNDGDGGSSHNSLLQDGAAHGRDSWPVTQLKKLKEYSEVAAGPKWKNFVRRIGRAFNPGRAVAGGGGTQFQYSPQSYALNFEGRDEDGFLMHSFSSRYVPQDQLRKGPGL